MASFQFVNLTNPADIKDKQAQSFIRGHAIRTSVRKTRKEAIQRRENFVAVDIDPYDGRPVKKVAKDKWKQEKKALMTRAPSAGLVDPFNCLPACPERLRSLMRHRRAKQAGEPVFCIEDAGKMYFQGVDDIFQGALTDPALFHALSLVLSLSANDDVPNVECLTHRGELLANLGKALANPDKLTKVSTLTAMLLLIGFEYRVDGVDARNSIPVHIRAADELLRANYPIGAFGAAIRRALFWQDLYGSLMVGTSRYLSHTHFSEFCWTRDPARSHDYRVPPGFQSMIDSGVLPPDCATLLEDLNSVYKLLDDHCRYISPASAIWELRIDDAQAWLESRITDLLARWRASQQKDPVHGACMLAAFLCTYKLSTVIWDGCYIPEWVASQIVRILTRSSNNPSWDATPELVLWLLFVAGGLTQRNATRLRASVLILSTYRKQVEKMHKSWFSLKEVLAKFIWSEHVVAGRFFRYWEELHPEQCSERRTAHKDILDRDWDCDPLADVRGLWWEKEVIPRAQGLS